MEKINNIQINYGIIKVSFLKFILKISTLWNLLLNNLLIRIDTFLNENFQLLADM